MIGEFFVFIKNKSIFAFLFILIFFSSAKAQSIPSVPTVKPLTDKQLASDSVFQWVEKVPEFPGGLYKFNAYVKKTQKWPDDFKGSNAFVIISVIVEKNGALTDIKIARGESPAFDQEALRIVRRSSWWRPGSIRGTPVRSLYYIPISFER